MPLEFHPTYTRKDLAEGKERESIRKLKHDDIIYIRIRTQDLPPAASHGTNNINTSEFTFHRDAVGKFEIEAAGIVRDDCLVLKSTVSPKKGKGRYSYTLPIHDVPFQSLPVTIMEFDDSEQVIAKKGTIRLAPTPIQQPVYGPVLPKKQ